MSLYVTSSCGLTNSVSTLTDKLLSMKPDSRFDLVQFSTSQQHDALLPAARVDQSYARLETANQVSTCGTKQVQNDSSQDSDSSSEDPTQVLLNSKANKDPSTKPSLSYIALISMAIQSLPQKRMLLSEIYQWITDNFPYYQCKDKSWRNSIRHNLSLNECFIKNGRSENGKGNYWSIHPANVDDFGKGDFRRRRARRRVRKCDELQRKYQDGTNMMAPQDPNYYCVSSYNSYVPMMSTYAPTPMLSNIFGVENVLSREEQLQRYYQQLSNTKPLPNISNVSSMFSDTDLIGNSGYQTPVPSVPSVQNMPIQSAASSFQDNVFTTQVQSQTLSSISLTGALPSWQDTLSRLQTDLGGIV